MPRTFHKPAPYMVLQDSAPIKKDALWLRKCFAPLMAKRLPTVLYTGFKHDFIISYVQQHKKQYPYFLKMDIAKFYPSISHHHLVVETQLAYKNLLGLSYVPKRFKAQALPMLHRFFQELPTEGYGIPLNSSMAKAVSPLIYVNFLLQLKKQGDCRFIVYADDFLFLCRSAKACEQLYIDFSNFLYHVDLKVNMLKVQQGRFASATLDFCGYRFSGGYVSVSPEKIQQFKESILKHCHNTNNRTKLWDERRLIKTINAKVNGFGHYYKYAHVKRLYHHLDAFIRQQVRDLYKQLGLASPTLKEFYHLGLRSLALILQKKQQKLISPKAYKIYKESTKTYTNRARDFINIPYLEKLIHQQTEIIAQLKQMNRHQQELIKRLDL
uniref:reverse transcriptase domain-containing protein n=1 Tax=Ornithobacterium rhinotracheale TaxID=28251 RepID=UPI0039A51E1C